MDSKTEKGRQRRRKRRGKGKRKEENELQLRKWKSEKRFQIPGTYTIRVPGSQAFGLKPEFTTLAFLGLSFSASPSFSN
ncbi:uncharacterized protein [Macaca nemestrina]|uniref:uncharacterized protein n=1 Tax=Macaca nemestrina TaxID=9545 RepID=UPI0039B88CBD